MIYVFIAATYFPWVMLRPLPQNTIAAELWWLVWVNNLFSNVNITIVIYFIYNRFCLTLLSYSLHTIQLGFLKFLYAIFLLAM